MRVALHPATCGYNLDLLADYCRYLGVKDLFYQLHDILGYRDGGLDDPEALLSLQDSYAKAGLKLSALNDFLPNTPDELDRRREGLLGTLEQMAAARVETLILFVLQEDKPELPGPLEGLYKALIPRAGSLGVKLATHGHWCEGHIAHNLRTVKRIINSDPSPANGICLCAGCYWQAGDDPAAVIREIPDRIHCVHIRDTNQRGSCELEELPLGAGSVPIRETLAALSEIGYRGLVIPEHLSSVNAQANMEVTHAHAVGYLGGIARAIAF